MNTLYICYFGLREPLVQSQVVPYLRELAASEIQPTLLTFEPRNPACNAGKLCESRESGGFRFGITNFRRCLRPRMTFCGETWCRAMWRGSIGLMLFMLGDMYRLQWRPWRVCLVWLS